MSLRGLYAITSESLCRNPRRLLAGVEAALRGGAALIQYRDKWSPREQRDGIARELLALCKAHGRLLIINDDVALAARTGAHGVHVGQTDIPVAAARELLGRQALIGVSCGNDPALALRAAAEGADYVAFGRFFPSKTKPEAPPADAGTLHRARSLLHPQMAVCAIGGITPENGGALLEAGADLLAAVEGVFGADDIEAAARAYTRLIQ